MYNNIRIIVLCEEINYGDCESCYRAEHFIIHKLPIISKCTNDVNIITL